MHKPKTMVVMPAYNAEKTLGQTIKDIPPGLIDKIILVDDNSQDQTVKLAKKLGLTVIAHSQNRGYGGNQKTCYTMALSEGAGIIVMIHPDYQYDSSLTGELIRPIIEGRFEVMFGSRIRTRAEALAGGMPWWKYLANRALSVMENLVLGLNLSEYHTGFRAFDSRVLKELPFHRYSDNFVFDQDIVMGIVAKGFRIGEIPVPVRYFNEASSANFGQSTIYGLSIIWDLVLYVLTRGRWFTRKR